MDISKIYHSANPFLTCILHCINNYVGYSKYIKNTIPVPTTLNLFLKLFNDTSSNTYMLIIPSHYFHIFIHNNWLNPLHIKHMFPMHDKHIYTIKKANDVWVKLDSHPSLKSTINEKEMIFEISKGIGCIIIIDKDKRSLFHTIVSEWNPPNEYYNTFKINLLSNL